MVARGLVRQKYRWRHVHGRECVRGAREGHKWREDARCRRKLSVKEIEELEQGTFSNTSVNTLLPPTFLFVCSSSAVLWFEGGARPQHVDMATPSTSNGNNMRLGSQ